LVTLALTGQVTRPSTLAEASGCGGGDFGTTRYDDFAFGVHEVFGRGMADASLAVAALVTLRYGVSMKP
jgi:hypothetical protein